MLKEDIQAVSEDPEALERLFRQTEADGRSADFKEALSQVHAENLDDRILSAWAYRLDLAPIKQLPEEIIPAPPAVAGVRRWLYALIIGLSQGLIFTEVYNWLVANQDINRPPSWLWIDWSAVVALAILAYLASVDRRTDRRRFYVYSAGGAIAVALIASVLFWNIKGDRAVLVGLHIPLLMWSLIGASVALGRQNPSRQFFSYAVKSVEVIFTGLVYFAMGSVFIGLSAEVFSVLQINLPARLIGSFAACGIGFIPIIAFASVYDASLAPKNQASGSGPAQILRIGARLLLPLSIAVLAIYAAFIPSHFWEPFRQRDLLLAYNLTILALIVLFAYVVPGPDEKIAQSQKQAIRFALLAACVLTLSLTGYAIAAAVSRAAAHGLTANRETIIGWNMACLMLLTAVATSLVKGTSDRWPESFGTWFSRGLMVILAWAAYVVFVLPFQF